MNRKRIIFSQSKSDINVGVDEKKEIYFVNGKQFILTFSVQTIRRLSFDTVTV